MQDRKAPPAFFEIPYYHDYLSPSLARHLLAQASSVAGVPGLEQLGPNSGLETGPALQFLVNLYEAIKPDLQQVLKRRADDRRFVDERTRACAEYNKSLGIDFLDLDYKTVLGLKDANGRIVVGPNHPEFNRRGGKAVAPIPAYLQGPHVTLFGPPDSAKLAINAMNAYHRKLKDEPAIVAELLATQQASPKWGADDEDSKTPLRRDLVDAAVNLTACFDGSLNLVEGNKTYALAADHLSNPMKRFPGLALPSSFLFYNNNPIPLHLYDFALHFFSNWHNPQSLAFYVPKLENEEEARYIHRMLFASETMLKELHPEYQLGTIRVMIVLENPRAILRAHEIMDELYPYFVGASLGWHDYLGSTARLFKEDGNYRIPVKADPNIVIKYIKASHTLLADVVGSRGGIKVGGMYGILPLQANLASASFQIALLGFFKDVVTQLKRDLTGFWVAHPDFVRLGLAIVEAWKRYQQGNSTALFSLTASIFQEQYRSEIDDFIRKQDVTGLDSADQNYVRSLLVADIRESDYIPNNHPDEIRYNVFQSLQYLTDWLCGNGCVALPTIIDGIPVRVMDDLATAERSRWEIWHELYHGRFAREDFLRICYEELHYIRKDLSNDQKIVQVKWDARTEKWYPVAFRIMIQLMTAKVPAEFATELLMPFTVDDIRQAENPWQKAQILDHDKFKLDPYLERWIYYFERCGSQVFATKMAGNALSDHLAAAAVIRAFTLADINAAARFHGDIGEAQASLDTHAKAEQQRAQGGDASTRAALRSLGQKYQDKFGFKFLVAARDRSASELLAILNMRLVRTPDEELAAAREALWDITAQRLVANPLDQTQEQIAAIAAKHQLTGASIAVANPNGLQSIYIGDAVHGREKVHSTTLFELASLSKTVACAWAMEFFAHRQISLDTAVNELLAQTSSPYRLRSTRDPAFAEAVTLRHLMSHKALNMHYVKGFRLDQTLPSIADLVLRGTEYGYEPLDVLAKPGSQFQYSGGGFLLLEYLIECLAQTPIVALTTPFLKQLGLADITFEQRTLPHRHYATGYFDDGKSVPTSRLMFPAFAAGALGTSTDMMRFLRHLERAYHDLDGSGGISHDTAIEMLHASDRDLGSQDFIGCDLGTGVFVAQAGENRIVVHQGSNEGFRAIFLHVVTGPDRGKGFTVLCNGDHRGVLFVAEAAQCLLKALAIDGINFDQFSKNFEISSQSEEQIVNLGYKQLIFSAFQPTLPEAISGHQARDFLASCNLLGEATILTVTNQRFARAENLFSPFEPVFEAHLFGRQGKIMDSWESSRHNPTACDAVECVMRRPSAIEFVRLSTKFHDGNHPQFVRILGRIDKRSPWQEILPKVTMSGHSFRQIKLAKPTELVSDIRIEIYPDGGLARVGLYSNLSASECQGFCPLEASECTRFPDPISQSQKPLPIPFTLTSAEIARHMQRASQHSQALDYASAAYGGLVMRATNEHYGPAAQLISPFPAINMFDGLESARSRTPGHFEEVVLNLSKAIRIACVEFDFTFFVNNNPLYVQLFGWDGEIWQVISPSVPVKAFAGNKKRVAIKTELVTDQLKIRTCPDGGINRVHVYDRLVDLPK